MEWASALGAPTPVAAAVKGVLDGAVAGGLGGADWSELVAVAEQQASVTLHWDSQ